MEMNSRSSSAQAGSGEAHAAGAGEDMSMSGERSGGGAAAPACRAADGSGAAGDCQASWGVRQAGRAGREARIQVARRATHRLVLPHLHQRSLRREGYAPAAQAGAQLLQLRRVRARGGGARHVPERGAAALQDLRRRSARQATADGGRVVVPGAHGGARRGVLGAAVLFVAGGRAARRVRRRGRGAAHGADGLRRVRRLASFDFRSNFNG